MSGTARSSFCEAPRFGIVGRDQTIRAVVMERGGTGSAFVTVRRDGQEFARQQVRADTPFSIDVRVEHGGANVIELEVDGLPDELTLANNRAVIQLEGIREKLRVLLVSGEPHPGERTWRNLLKSDANVDLVHFTILRPPEKQDGTPINELSLIAFPTRELFQQKIKDFDLIIFDRYANQSVLPPSYFDNIVRYVRDGGAMLVAAGPEFASYGSLAQTRLAPIIPGTPNGRIVEEPYKAHITDTGNRHPVTRDLPGSETQPPAWGEWLRIIGSQVGSGSTLMSGANELPLLVLKREEKGRVALLLSDHAWLWARGYNDGGPHLDLLRRLAHWLMKEPALEEEALRASAVGREIRVERQTMKDVADPVTLTAPSGAQSNVELTQTRPGLFTAEVTGSELGLAYAPLGRTRHLRQHRAGQSARNDRRVQQYGSTASHRRSHRRLDPPRGDGRRQGNYRPAHPGRSLGHPAFRRRLDRHQTERERGRSRRLDPAAGARLPRAGAPRRRHADRLGGRRPQTRLTSEPYSVRVETMPAPVRVLRRSIPGPGTAPD